jgi:hypothetical protein
MQEEEAEIFEHELRGFGQSLRAAAVKPGSFWIRQQALIRGRLRSTAPAMRRRTIYVWIPAAAIVVICFFWSTAPRTTPMPDIATGYDQRLLIEVEQALKQSSPEALARAGLIAGEMRSAVGSRQSLVDSR